SNGIQGIARPLPPCRSRSLMSKSLKLCSGADAVKNSKGLAGQLHGFVPFQKSLVSFENIKLFLGLVCEKNFEQEKS
ncbi:MAG: hypothetical protein QMD01_09005, partial [Thermodesulfovibrionales bacterium]|nr:hypothetical protein [Thermodesulfovibrionales bacterium]